MRLERNSCVPSKGCVLLPKGNWEQLQEFKQNEIQLKLEFQIAQSG